MMQSGLSRELFESWCTDSKNGVIIAGYCVEGTLAKTILSEPEEITTLTGQKLPLKMSVDYISFSAHTDYQQTSEFIRILKPPHVVLVHGEQNEMGRLKAALQREYEDDPNTKIEIHNPKNTVAVELYFRGEKTAKVRPFAPLKSPLTSLKTTSKTGSCHKRQKPQAPTQHAPIRNRQTRKVANAKDLNRNTNPT